MWADHWDIVMAFLACSTQWNHAGMTGVRTGLNYPGVDVVLRLTVPDERRAEVFQGIQTMERAALSVFAQQAQESSRRRAPPLKKRR